MLGRQIALPLAAMVLIVGAAVAAQAQKGVGVGRGPAILMVNGKDAFADVHPQMIEGRVMVPIRFVAQQLGATVDWRPQTREIWLRHGTRTMTMIVGTDRAQLNGLAQTLSVAPTIRDGRTLLPLRDVTRFTGGIADYNAETGVVTVTTPGGRGRG